MRGEPLLARRLARPGADQKLSAFWPRDAPTGGWALRQAKDHSPRILQSRTCRSITGAAFGPSRCGPKTVRFLASRCSHRRMGAPTSHGSFATYSESHTCRSATGAAFGPSKCGPKTVRFLALRSSHGRIGALTSDGSIATYFAIAPFAESLLVRRLVHPGADQKLPAFSLTGACWPGYDTEFPTNKLQKADSLPPWYVRRSEISFRNLFFLAPT